MKPRQMGRKAASMAEWFLEEGTSRRHRNLPEVAKTRRHLRFTDGERAMAKRFIARSERRDAKAALRAELA